MTHIPLVAGIITTAATTEEILLHPKDEVHTEFLIMFVAGITLFFGGVALAVFISFRAVAIERLATIAAIAVLTLVGSSLDGVTLLFIVDGLILVGLIAEHRRVENMQPVASEPTPTHARSKK